MPLLFIYSVHSYLNYANTASCAALIDLSEKTSKSTKAHYQNYLSRKQACTQTRAFQRKQCIKYLSIKYFQQLSFSISSQKGKVPNVFLSKLLCPSHNYPTNLSRNNCILLSFKLTKSRYRITIRAPKLRNITMNIEKKPCNF